MANWPLSMGWWQTHITVLSFSSLWLASSKNKFSPFMCWVPPRWHVPQRSDNQFDIFQWMIRKAVKPKAEIQWGESPPIAHLGSSKQCDLWRTCRDRSLVGYPSLICSEAHFPACRGVHVAKPLGWCPWKKCHLAMSSSATGTSKWRILLSCGSWWVYLYGEKKNITRTI